MLYSQLVAILAGTKLGHQPLASIDPQPRTLDHIAIGAGVPVRVFPLVARAVVGYLHDLLGRVLGSGCTCTRVVVREAARVFHDPKQHRAFGWHGFIAAY